MPLLIRLTLCLAPLFLVGCGEDKPNESGELKLVKEENARLKKELHETQQDLGRLKAKYNDLIRRMNRNSRLVRTPAVEPPDLSTSSTAPAGYDSKRTEAMIDNLSKRHPPNEIAKLLNQRQVSSPSAGPWTGADVARIISLLKRRAEMNRE